jgi:hypothetical protein
MIFCVYTMISLNYQAFLSLNLNTVQLSSIPPSPP